MNSLPAEAIIEYYFEGDASLPFAIADFDESILALTESRKERLVEWLGGDLIVNGTIEPGVNITGPVHIGKNTVISAGVELQGPVFIGNDCSIRHGAQLRSGTILGNGCVVGHGAEIKNSVCMAGSKLQSGVFVGDSILGLGARVGSGTILANRRFGQDAISLKAGTERIQTEVEFFGAIVGDYARLGANVVTAPGTVVGPYTWVSSLVSLHGFIPRAKLVLLKQELDIRDKPEAKLRSGRGEYEPN